MWKEFTSFLIKQNVFALAIAVVIGTALNDVVKSLVDGLIMPIVSAVTPDPAGWQEVVTPGPIAFKPGVIAFAVLNFLIIGIVAWRLSKLFIREAPAAAPRAVKTCPFCLSADLDEKARRCPHCTSALDGASAVGRVLATSAALAPKP